ncbi:MAG TPA: sugar ABC transporter permease [Roseiflexaceae bacterium]|nr:sugar ABC transporter permease [Roseiflexaceae bacterium]
MQSTSRLQARSPSAFIDRLLHRDSSLGYILLGPGFLFLALMMAYPFVYAVYLSFTDKQIGAPASFTGFENYVKLFGTSLFWKTVKNSLVYTAIALVLKFCGGLALAALLNRPFIGQRVVKAMLLLPWIMPTVFSTMIWSWIFHPTFSIVNDILVAKLGLLSEPIPFLRDERWAMASLIFVNVWRGVPFFGITFLAAIQSVSTDIVEASKIDGASAWVSFWRITFPMILPVVIIVMLISTIGTLGDFDLPFLLTRGGPNDATTLFSLTAYTLSFSSGLIGLGAAVTMTMFPVLILLVIASLISVRRQQQD